MLRLVIMSGKLSEKFMSYRRSLHLFSASERDLISPVPTLHHVQSLLFASSKRAPGLDLGFTTIYDKVTIWSDVAR